jgi:uptake hydrogenase small subunit
MATMLWLQAGACSGNTISLLNADEPTVIDLLTDFGVELVWHPSLGVELGEAAQKIMYDLTSGARPLDIFVVEGTVILGPNGTGRMDMFCGRPMTEWITELSSVASIVVGVGDCATFGGLPTVPPNPSESTGLQFHRAEKGGFLGKDWVSKLGLPVINIPGCPAHPDWITQVVMAVATGRAGDLALDEYNRPATFFTSFTHTGCTRNQFFEYKQSTMEFGQGTRTGCLFYELSCRGPMTHSSCNRILWNRQSSKTRAGMPCIGCTEPGFPHYDLAPETVFKTQKVSGVIPKDLPSGADSLTYLAAAAAARISAPQWAKEDMFVV